MEFRAARCKFPQNSRSGGGRRLDLGLPALQFRNLFADGADILDGRRPVAVLSGEAATRIWRRSQRRDCRGRRFLGATFPDACPWTVEQVLAAEFWPG